MDMERSMEDIPIVLSSIDSLQACCTNPAGQPQSDSTKSCEIDCDCPKLLRQLFYQLWQASENSFRNQEEAMKFFCSRGNFEAHVDEHADLTHALTNIMAGYRMSRQCRGIFAEVRKFAEKLDRHQRTMDAELLLFKAAAGGCSAKSPAGRSGS